jgi:hypothetical protein
MQLTLDQISILKVEGNKQFFKSVSERKLTLFGINCKTRIFRFGWISLTVELN